VSRAATPADYAVLGLELDAGDDEIRAAYRRLAKQHHPDRNPGDPAALTTFQRITESYAALRGRRAADAPPLSPLSAARAARRRASARRGSAPGAAGLAQLPVGASLWLDASALLLAPDRGVTLRPGARGSTFPTPEHVIRAERRADGFHVFLPPQPSARWAVSRSAETEGLAVVALWVGERQDGPTGAPSGARLPLRLVGGTVGEMVPGDRGWTAANALAAHTDGSWSIDLAQPLSHEPHRATRLRVIRDDDGFRVHSDLPAAEFAGPAPAETASRAPVVSAILAGTQFHASEAAG
jgi:hypothetical protein